MFVSQQKFFSDYRIKNGQAPNETVLNRGLMRLKREIRELKSLLDIISNQEIEEFSAQQIYEEDEYVMYRNSYYRSKCDHNYANSPENEQFWELVKLPSIKEGTTRTHAQKFTSEPEQQRFDTEFSMSERPMVFVDGILQDISVYTWGSRNVTFTEPLENGRRVHILYGYAYDSPNILPYREITAEYGQSVFEVPFQLIEPHVFVNGILKREDSYSYGRSYVQFPNELRDGDTVVIANGNFVGMDFYTRLEMDRILDQYYKKSETYSRAQLDNMFAQKADLAYCDATYRTIADSYSVTAMNNILSYYVQTDQFNNELAKKADLGTTLFDYHIEDAYTKSDTEALINQIWDYQFNEGRLHAELNAKANWGTTLSDYNIDNAYSKMEIDALLVPLMKSEDFNTSNILEKISGNPELNAKQLDGYTREQFMRSDDKTSNTGGIDVYNEDNSDFISIGEDLIKSRYNLDTQHYECQYYGDEVHDMYINIEGEFKGDFDFNIMDTGISCPDEYNWTVYVQPVIDGNRTDFIPERYGNGFTFRKEVHDAKAWEHTFYHFGYVEIRGTVKRSFICHLKSFYRNGELEMIPSLSHYKLVGVKKEGSSFIRFNQGSVALEERDFRFSEAELDYIDTRYGRGTSTVQNALVDMYTAPKSKPYHVVGHASRYEFTVFDDIQVVFNGLKPLEKVEFGFDNPVEISAKDNNADENGTAHCVFKYNMEGSLIVQCSGVDSDIGYLQLQVQDVHEDDPDTTMVFGQTPWNHAVFTNGNTKYPLGSTTKYKIEDLLRSYSILETETKTITFKSDAPIIEIESENLDNRISVKQTVFDTSGLNTYELEIHGDSPAEFNFTVKARGAEESEASRTTDMTIHLNVQEIILELPELINIPLGRTVQVPFRTNCAIEDITLTISHVIAEGELVNDADYINIHGLIIGNTEISVEAHGKKKSYRIVVYDPSDTQEGSDDSDVPKPEPGDSEVTEEPEVQEPETPTDETDEPEEPAEP